MPRLLFLGDIVGRPGRRILAERLQEIRQTHRIDTVVANGENAAAGAGINARLAREILETGVDGITLGDHLWDQKEFPGEIDQLERVCRPANLDSASPGRTHLLLSCGGLRLAVCTLLGHTFMKMKADCPFRAAEKCVPALRAEADAVLVEIHAEATSEKIAMGWFLDGQATLVVGTHTHVPTADATILPRGTAYLTDAGMTGPYRSVIGREVDPVLGKMLDGLPRKFAVATEDVWMRGVLVEFDSSGSAQSITPLAVPTTSAEAGL